MKVKELIVKLAAKDPELDVLLNLEGELVPVKTVEEIVTRQYAGGSAHVDYYPEIEPDEDEVRGKALLIDYKVREKFKDCVNGVRPIAPNVTEDCW
jgi:hypothetical protein